MSIVHGGIYVGIVTVPCHVPFVFEPLILWAMTPPGQPAAVLEGEIIEAGVVDV